MKTQIMKSSSRGLSREVKQIQGRATLHIFLVSLAISSNLCDTGISVHAHPQYGGMRSCVTDFPKNKSATFLLWL